MTGSDWITIVGTIVTIGSAIFTIVQARKAMHASVDANAAVANVRLAANADRLRSAQEHIRRLPCTKPLVQRGADWDRWIASIRQEFDATLGVLSTVGPGSKARRLVVNAQNSLNQYEQDLHNNDVNREAWQILQTQVQEAISDLTAIVTLPREIK